MPLGLLEGQIKTVSLKRSRTDKKATMTDKLRVVQVGCGSRAQQHIAAMLGSGAIDLVALCDLDDQKLQATGDAFGIARRYHDLAAMIREQQPELVDIV